MDIIRRISSVKNEPLLTDWSHTVQCARVKRKILVFFMKKARRPPFLDAIVNAEPTECSQAPLLSSKGLYFTVLSFHFVPHPKILHIATPTRPQSFQRNFSMSVVNTKPSSVIIFRMQGCRDCPTHWGLVQEQASDRPGRQALACQPSHAPPPGAPTSARRPVPAV